MKDTFIICEGGGNHHVVAIPLVALGTHNGLTDVIDVSANVVAASYRYVNFV